MDNKYKLHLLKDKYITQIAMSGFYQISNLSEHIEDENGIYLSFDLTIKDTDWLEKYTILYTNDNQVKIISDFDSMSYWGFRFKLNIIQNCMADIFSYARVCI